MMMMMMMTTKHLKAKTWKLSIQRVIWQHQQQGYFVETMIAVFLLFIIVRVFFYFSFTEEEKFSLFLTGFFLSSFGMNVFFLLRRWTPSVDGEFFKGYTDIYVKRSMSLPLNRCGEYIHTYLTLFLSLSIFLSLTDTRYSGYQVYFLFFAITILYIFK